MYYNKYFLLTHNTFDFKFLNKMQNMENSGRSFQSFELYPMDTALATTMKSAKDRERAFMLLLAINTILNYDSGVIPGSLLQIQEEIPMTFTQKAALGSLVYLGLSFASLIVSFFFQKFSASKCLIVMLSLNSAFCLLFSFSYTLETMYLGRLGMGFTQAFHVIYAPV